MLKTLRLLLPALIPSWRFFDAIAASPRIEYALWSSPAEPSGAWCEFRPRPARRSPLATLWSLVWNPRWNESLFLVSCAERLIDQPTAHSEDEIFRRIAADLARPDPGRAAPADLPAPWLCFRLVFLSRDGDAIAREVLFEAAPRRRADLAGG